MAGEMILNADGMVLLGTDRVFLPSVTVDGLISHGAVPAAGYAGEGYDRYRLAVGEAVLVFQFHHGRLQRLTVFSEGSDLRDLRVTDDGDHGWGRVERTTDPKTSDRSIVVDVDRKPDG